MEYKSKYDLGDIVWILSNNKVKIGSVEEIFFVKTKNVYSYKGDDEIGLTYKIWIFKEDYYEYNVEEKCIFKNREDLIESL